MILLAQSQKNVKKQKNHIKNKFCSEICFEFASCGTTLLFLCCLHSSGHLVLFGPICEFAKVSQLAKCNLLSGKQLFHALAWSHPRPPFLPSRSAFIGRKVRTCVSDVASSYEGGGRGGEAEREERFIVHNSGGDDRRRSSRPPSHTRSSGVSTGFAAFAKNNSCTLVSVAHEPCKYVFFQMRKWSRMFRACVLCWRMFLQAAAKMQEERRQRSARKYSRISRAISA